MFHILSVSLALVGCLTAVENQQRFDDFHSAEVSPSCFPPDTQVADFPRHVWVSMMKEHEDTWEKTWFEAIQKDDRQKIMDMFDPDRIDERDHNGCKASDLAILSNNTALFQFFKERDADICRAPCEEEETLFNVTRNGNLEILQYLVEVCNMDVNFKDPQKNTPIGIALKAKKIDIVIFLSAYGSDVNNVIDKTQLLDLAVRQESLHTIPFLIQQATYTSVYEAVTTILLDPSLLNSPQGKQVKSMLFDALKKRAMDSSYNLIQHALFIWTYPSVTFFGWLLYLLGIDHTARSFSFFKIFSYNLCIPMILLPLQEIIIYFINGKERYGIAIRIHLWITRFSAAKEMISVFVEYAKSEIRLEYKNECLKQSIRSSLTACCAEIPKEITDIIISYYLLPMESDLLDFDPLYAHLMGCFKN